MSQLKESPQVSFSEAAQNVFKKMFQFKGRIRRSEYWWGVLVLTICAIVLSLIPSFLLLARLLYYSSTLLQHPCCSVAYMTLAEVAGGGAVSSALVLYLLSFLPQPLTFTPICRL